MDKQERLTQRNADGGISVRDLPAALKKLAELEDAEEDGRLARLPVKPGETVYTLASNSGPILERVIKRIDINKSDSGDGPDIEIAFYTHRTDGKPDNMGWFMLNEIGGPTIFLTRAEAEAALQSMNIVKNRTDGE